MNLAVSLITSTFSHFLHVSITPASSIYYLLFPVFSFSPSYLPIPVYKAKCVVKLTPWETVNLNENIIVVNCLPICNSVYPHESLNLLTELKTLLFLKTSGSEAPTGWEILHFWCKYSNQSLFRVAYCPHFFPPASSRKFCFCVIRYSVQPAAESMKWAAKWIPSWKFALEALKQ